MANRIFADWLSAYIDYAAVGEAPKHMHFWAGVSAIAGALRRKVWIDMGHFQWYPGFYIILVAPPGVVTKSTTASIGINLLREVPGITFGPDIVTWQALIDCFAEATETFEDSGMFHEMSPITLCASEFGNLFDPNDRDMVDLFVDLWDGRTGGLRKRTKKDGDLSISNPWINLIACTTPAWMAGNFPEYMIGGGFTSRCVFVYADKKEKLIAYPKRHIRFDMEGTKKKLISDLQKISLLHGEFTLTESAMEWGEAWYKDHYATISTKLFDDRYGGYIARKQSHIHKLAMILAVSIGDSLVLTPELLQLAESMTTDLESDMMKVFAKIGKSDTSVQVDRLLAFVKARNVVEYQELYQYVHSYFPSDKAFADVLAGCINSGQLHLTHRGGEHYVNFGPGGGNNKQK